MVRIFENDVGTTVTLSTCVDLTGFESGCICIQKPSGSQLSWSASLSGAASLGMIKYVASASDDFDETGTWLASARVDITDTGSWTGETAEFEVWSQFER